MLHRTKLLSRNSPARRDTKTKMETNQPTSQPTPAGGFQLVPADQIDDPARPLRTDITPESVQDLVLSIKQMGVIEPIIVRPKGDRYEVIAGHRRLLAATIAKLPLLPAIVRNSGNEETEIIKLHENIYRQDIRPSDEAKHFDYLIQRLKLTPAKIAQLIGRSQSYISDRLAIFNYPPALLASLDQGKITFSVARTFSRHPDPERINTFVRYAVSNGMTPSMAEKWVKDDLRLLEQRANQPISVPPENGGSPVETPFYHCYLCSEGISIQDLVPIYLHTFCDNKFRSTITSSPSLGDIPNS